MVLPTLLDGVVSAHTRPPAQTYACLAVTIAGTDPLIDNSSCCFCNFFCDIKYVLFPIPSLGHGLLSCCINIFDVRTHENVTQNGTFFGDGLFLAVFPVPTTAMAAANACSHHEDTWTYDQAVDLLMRIYKDSSSGKLKALALTVR
jgi:hypothetical protein